MSDMVDIIGKVALLAVLFFLMKNSDDYEKRLIKLETKIELKTMNCNRG